MANCGRQKFSPENVHFELLYGYQKATTARSCVCVKHYFSLSKSGHFGEKMYPTLNVMKKSICPLVCWKFQPQKHQSRSVAHKPPCCYRATFLVPVPWISLLSHWFFARNTYFMSNREKTWQLGTYGGSSRKPSFHFYFKNIGRIKSQTPFGKRLWT